ncbi:hypothetical protein [Romboutsia sp.]|uniref:hypothetical protein n=1 Tax=Romboutsia sp. TaxID=1965302 RepID=UPI003F419EB1
MKKVIIYTFLFLVLIVIGGFINKSENIAQVYNLKEPIGSTKEVNPWTDVNDIKEIYNQLGAKFEIAPPKDFKLAYMAKGTQSMVDEGRIKPWGKVVYTNGEKEITVQIVKGLELFEHARINYDATPISSIHSFYDKDTKRIVYSQEEYTILIDIEGMEQDFSFVGMAKLK